MSTLGGDDVRAWRLRVPQLVIAWGVPLTIVAGITLFGGGDGSDEDLEPPIQELVSIEWMLEWSLFYILVFVVAFAWLYPRLALWGMAALCASFAFGAESPGELAFDAVWPIIAITDLVLARRQSAMAQRWKRLGPGSDENTLAPPPGLGNRAAWWGFATVPFVVALAVFSLWLVERHELAQLDERAVSGSATVTELDTTFDYITFRLDSEEHESQVLDAAEYEVGQSIDVRIDPTGQFGPLGPETTDPHGLSFWGPLWAPLLLVAGILILTPLVRQRDRARAFADDRPVWAMVKPARADGGIVLMSDDLTPFAFSRKASTHYTLSRIEGQPPPPVTENPDNMYPARVYGLSRYERTALVEITELGMMLVPKTPLRDPFTTRALFRRIRGIRAADAGATNRSRLG